MVKSDAADLVSVEVPLPLAMTALMVRLPAPYCWIIKSELVAVPDLRAPPVTVSLIS